MATMRVAQVSRPGGPFEIVERPVPSPGGGEVRIRVHACGVCHSDSLVKEGHWPGLTYPRVPGHEVIGVIDAVGAGVRGWKEGDRVGAGWHGGHCGACHHCRRANFFACTTDLRITGVSFDGGYAEWMVAPIEALARVPSGLEAIDASPLMCAGITTFNALRHCGARPGDLVAIHGIGGLGHLGVQFAAKMGFEVAAIARGQDKAELARTLGATHYIDAAAQDPAAALSKLGGAAAILATVTDGPSMSATIAGLAPNGTLMVIGAVQSMEAQPMTLLMGRRSVKGWYSGTAVDSEDTLAFAALEGVRSMNEVFPLERAGEAYERMMSGKARFRVVLDMLTQKKG